MTPILLWIFWISLSTIDGWAVIALAIGSAVFLAWDVLYARRHYR